MVQVLRPKLFRYMTMTRDLDILCQELMREFEELQTSKTSRTSKGIQVNPAQEHITQHTQHMC
jgi:hypothetical protein